MFADKATAAKRADANAAAWKEARKSLKWSGSGCLLIVLAFAFLAVWLAGYVTALPSKGIAERSTPSR